MKGTNPANPKAPQGEKVGDVASTVTSGDSTQAK
jgi:hypothetical protein